MRLFALLAAFVIFSLPAAAVERGEAGYLRLKAPLDRPQDHYCLDVLGSGGFFRWDMPLIAHNCKPGAVADEMVAHRTDGTLYFPDFEACVTAMGVNTTLLPGAALMLKRCGDETPFLNGPAFQTFVALKSGQLQIQGFDLCLAVSAASDHTFAMDHTWRALFVAPCGSVEASLSEWEMTPPL